MDTSLQRMIDLQEDHNNIEKLKSEDCEVDELQEKKNSTQTCR